MATTHAPILDLVTRASGGICLSDITPLSAADEQLLTCTILAHLRADGQVCVSPEQLQSILSGIRPTGNWLRLEWSTENQCQSSQCAAATRRVALATVVRRGERYSLRVFRHRPANQSPGLQEVSAPTPMERGSIFNILGPIAKRPPVERPKRKRRGRKTGNALLGKVARTLVAAAGGDTYSMIEIADRVVDAAGAFRLAKGVPAGNLTIALRSRRDLEHFSDRIASSDWTHTRTTPHGLIVARADRVSDRSFRIGCEEFAVGGKIAIPGRPGYPGQYLLLAVYSRTNATTWAITAAYAHPLSTQGNLLLDSSLEAKVLGWLLEIRCENPRWPITIRKPLYPTTGRSFFDFELVYGSRTSRFVIEVLGSDGITYLNRKIAVGDRETAAGNVAYLVHAYRPGRKHDAEQKRRLKDEVRRWVHFSAKGSADPRHHR